jgi:SPP1 gp7 family putative phage head morphogenesis protein
VSRYVEMAKANKARKERKALARALRLPPAIERRYGKEVRGILIAVHRKFLETFDASALAIPRDGNVIRTNAKIGMHDANFAGLIQGIMPAVKHATAGAFDRMAVDVQKHARFALRGLTPQGLGLGAVIDQARDANIQLVEKAARSYAADVRAVIDDPANFGMYGSELRDQLIERGGISESRAELIGVDQSLKLNASINQAQQQKAGAERYMWSGVDDSREREMHVELNNRVFSWADPPVTNEAGDRNHPGRDYRCRCCAIPVFEETEIGSYYQG